MAIRIRAERSFVRVDMEYRIIFVFCAIIFTATSTVTKTYRNDYVYNQHTDAFYKMHIDSELRRRPGREAKSCEVEGATLLGELTQADIAQVHAMMKNYPDIGSYVYIASDGQQHDSVEQSPIIDMSFESGENNVPTSEVLSRDGKVESLPIYEDLPFVCKVQAKDVPYDQRCGVHASGYRYYSSVNSCYRIPPISYTWYQAHDECQAEGAHLAVVNSDTERLVLQNMTSLDGAVRYSWHQAYFHIGFRAEKTAANAPRVFKTIFNQTLEEAGFSEWSATEPNNLGGRENCGSVFQDDGKLNDINCSGLYAFICEKEVRANP